MKPFPAGKLPSDLLAALLARRAPADPRVVVGPGIGQDAAVLDMGSHYLVAKTDPITFATGEIGWYAVHVNANDIACMGAHPRWFLASVLLPQGRADAAMAESIYDQITAACESLDVELVGGHTEITIDLKRPIVAGALLGEVAKEKLVTTRGAQVGDVVCLTKGIPLEGTALIAREKSEDLAQRGVAPELIVRAQMLLRSPGISIVREALLAADAGLATAMHDPTEGGLATGLRELAQAAGVGLAIEVSVIPILEEGAELCALYGLDPLGVLASGSLLLTTPAVKFDELCNLLHSAGIRCTKIGRVVPAAEGLTMSDAGSSRPLPQFPTDEIARLFGSTPHATELF